jgi:hypothetical protein
MLDPRELMHAHADALFTLDARGDLLRVNEPAGDVAPRFFLGMTAAGPLVRFRADVDRATRDELTQTAARVQPGPDVLNRALDASPFLVILARSRPIEKTWLGPAFLCSGDVPPCPAAIRIDADNRELLRPLLGEWVADVPLCQPMRALVLEARAVAVCCSVRRTDTAHEAGVETAAAFRGRGHGAEAVRAWILAVREAGRLPLYSTSWQNVASQAVAKKLGFLLFDNDLHVT